jgi:hypothetical protein
MSGLLRRFRRGKPKEEEESDPSEAPESARESDTDIYPHRAPSSTDGSPDSPDTDGPRGPEEAGGELVSPPAELPEEIGPAPEEPSASAIAPPDATPAAENVPDLPSSAPPRLPEAGSAGGRSVHRPLTAPSHCFLCGAELAGSFCPTCRMTWNE